MNNNTNNSFSLSKNFYLVKTNNIVGNIINEDDTYIYLKLYDNTIIKIEKKNLKKI